VKGRAQEAERVLREIGAADVAGELASYARGHMAAGSKLSWRRYRKPMLLAFAIAAFNQLSGINAILYYANDIFAAAGFGKVSADLQSVMIGATNLLFTLLALTVIDRLGRKTLLMIGSVGMVVALAATAWIQLSGTNRDLLLWALVLFIAAFAFSQGAVIWVYISEIFPTEVRARGQSLGASTHWLMDAIVAGVFPAMAARSNGLPFILFALAMLVQLFVVARWFVETKGVRLEDIDV
jgi:MFS family permease